MSQTGPEPESGRSQAGAGSSITVDQLIALNDEITALVRAGIPLDRGLVDEGGELPGRLGEISRAIGARMERGESLTEALEAERGTIPPLYRAVVEAGARSGRLPAALEGLAGYARGYASARSTIGLALWYPMVVLSLAYLLFIGLVVVIIPRLGAAFDSLKLPVSWPLALLERFGDLAVYWWPIGPVALVALGVLWVRSGRASSFSGQSWTFLKLVPWMRSLLADFEAANFAELLALLIEHGVTYPRALLLAAEASGNARLVTASSHLAEAIERGEPAKSALDRVDRAILPMLRWVLAAGERQGSLVTALRNLGVAYRTRASYKAESLRVFLPTLLMIGLGATATLFYGLTLFYPLASLLRQLGSP